MRRTEIREQETIISALASRLIAQVAEITHLGKESGLFQSQVQKDAICSLYMKSQNQTLLESVDPKQGHRDGHSSAGEKLKNLPS